MLENSDIGCLACNDEVANKLLSTKDAISHLDYLRDKKQEYLVCFSIDSGKRLIAHRIVTIGLLDMVLAHPREVFAAPVADRAAMIIVAHNHPSGDVKPSRSDIELTQRLAIAGQFLGISLIDHIIVTKKRHYSFKQHRML